jgi:hypothetical protein
LTAIKVLPALVSAAIACACGGLEPASLLVVVLDTTRADHLSCYGYAKPTTPAIDALAQRGARFELERLRALGYL